MAQFARPDSDSATGTWSSTPLWSKIDEGSPGDGTTITSDNNTSPDSADFTTTSVTDPASSSNHILRAAWNKDSSGGHAINAVLELYQGDPAGGGSLVATLSNTGIGATETEDSYTLTGTEADSITDYAALFLRVSRQGDTGGNPNGRRSLVVDFVELEVPDATSGTMFSQTITGTTTPSGSLRRKTATQRAGQVGPSGSVVKKTSTSLGGTVSPVGTIIKKAARAVAGSITSAGSLATRIVVQTTVTGSVSPSGTLGKKIKKVLSGTVTSTGAVTRKILKGVSGLCTPLGSVFKKAARSLAGQISAAGSLATGFKTSVTLTGNITSVGLLVSELLETVTGVGGISSVFFRTKKDDGTPRTIKETKDDLRGAITGETGAEDLPSLWNLYLDDRGVPDFDLTSRMRWHLQNNEGLTGKQINDLFKAWKGKL